MYNLSWLIIFLITLYDIYFAYENKATITEWELNPLAVYAVQHMGLFSLLIYRFVTILLGWIFVQYSNYKWLITILLLFVHLFLLGMYIG